MSHAFQGSADPAGLPLVLRKQRDAYLRQFRQTPPGSARRLALAEKIERTNIALGDALAAVSSSPSASESGSPSEVQS